MTQGIMHGGPHDVLHVFILLVCILHVFRLYVLNVFILPTWASQQSLP